MRYSGFEEVMGNRERFSECSGGMNVMEEVSMESVLYKVTLDSWCNRTRCGSV